MTTHRFGLSALAAMGLLLVLIPPPQAQAASEVREQIKLLAQDVARVLKDEGQGEIAVDVFTGPPAPTTSAGPMIQSALIEELQKLGVRVNDKAPVVVKGEYYIFDDDRMKEYLTLRLEALVRNNKGKQYTTWNGNVNYRGNEDLVKLLALNVDVSDKHKATREDVNTTIKKQVDKPPVATEENKAQVNPKGPYAVEVFTRPEGGGDYEVVKPTINDKKELIIVLEKGYEYILKLHNDHKYEAAATITIDGLDVFQFFQPAKEKPPYYVVPPGKVATVEGWVFGHNKETGVADYRRFLVTDFQNSAAAKGLKAEDAAYKSLKGSPVIGTITVMFYPCWEEGKTPPEYSDSRSAVVDDKATGVGDPASGKAKRVKRTVGPLSQAISLRYKK